MMIMDDLWHSRYKVELHFYQKFFCSWPNPGSCGLLFVYAVSYIEYLPAIKMLKMLKPLIIPDLHSAVAS